MIFRYLQGQLSVLVGVTAAILLIAGGILLLAIGYHDDRNTAISLQREVACRVGNSIENLQDIAPGIQELAKLQE